MTMLDIHSHMFLRNLTKVMAGKKFRLYTFKDYLELQHIDNNGYSVTIKENGWNGVNLYIHHNGVQVYFKGNYITESRLLNAVEESLQVIEEVIVDLVGQIQPGKVASLSDTFIRRLIMVTDYLGATVEQGWGVNVKNPKGSILILPSTDVKGVKLAVYDNEDREISGWANYRDEMDALKAIDEILTTGVLGDNKSEELQEDVTMLLGGINFLNNDKFSDSLVKGLKEIAEEYGVTFKQKANSLFLDTDSGEGYAMVFTTGGNRLHVNTVVNGYGNPGRTIPCPNNDAVFNTVKSLLEDRLGLKPKPKYANLEMIKRSRDFIISENEDEIVVDFAEPYVPYYASIKDGEITYGIYVADEERVKIDTAKIEVLEEICEFIIG